MMMKSLLACLLVASLTQPCKASDCWEVCKAGQPCYTECPIEVLPVAPPPSRKATQARTSANPRSPELNTCQYHYDGHCDEPVDCEYGTDTYDCRAQ